MSCTLHSCRSVALPREAPADNGGIEHYGLEVKASGDGIDLLPISFFRSGYLLVRVCGRCGLTEFRVPERFLEKVREKFPLVD